MPPTASISSAKALAQHSSPVLIIVFNSQLPCVCPFLVKKRVIVSKRAKYSYLPVGILLKSKGSVTTPPPSEVASSFRRTHYISASSSPPRPHSALQGPLRWHSDLPKGRDQVLAPWFSWCMLFTAICKPGALHTVNSSKSQVRERSNVSSLNPGDRLPSWPTG